MYKQVKADNGRAGHSEKIKCPQNAANPREKEKWVIHARVRAHYGALHGQLKS